MMIKNVLSISVLLCVLIYLAGCSARPSLKATLAPQNNYILSDNYANHRVQQKVFESSGGKIAYLDYAGGNTANKTIVLLHGVPTSSWLYRKMIPQLQGDYRVVAVDLLGYGSSDKPELTETNYRPIDQANYVLELLASIGVADYSLLFHDMGGLVAWEIVTQDLAERQQIKNLIVLNTIISKHGFDYPKMKKGAMAKAMSEAYASNLSSAAILEMTFDNMGLSSNAKLSENECRGYVAPMQEGADNALYDFFTGFDDAQFERLDAQIAGLSVFRGRVLILWGAQDKVLTTEQLPALLNVLEADSTEVQIYPNNAHFLQEEIPDELSAKIADFLQN